MILLLFGQSGTTLARSVLSWSMVAREIRLGVACPVCVKSALRYAVWLVAFQVSSCVMWDECPAVPADMRIAGPPSSQSRRPNGRGKGRDVRKLTILYLRNHATPSVGPHCRTARQCGVS